MLNDYNVCQFAWLITKPSYNPNAFLRAKQFILTLIASVTFQRILNDTCNYRGEKIFLILKALGGEVAVFLLEASGFLWKRQSELLLFGMYAALLWDARVWGIGASWLAFGVLEAWNNGILGDICKSQFLGKDFAFKALWSGCF